MRTHRRFRPYHKVFNIADEEIVSKSEMFYGTLQVES